MTAIKTISELSGPVQTSSDNAEIQPTPESGSVVSGQEAPPIAPEKPIEQTSDSTAAPVTTSSFASYKEAAEVAEKLQDRLDEIADVPRKATIRTDDEVDQYIIEIKDAQGNVVKRFPPEKVLNLHKRLDDLSGMVIDEMI